VRRDEFERYKRRTARDDQERFDQQQRRQQWIDLVAVVGLIVGVIALTVIVALTIVAWDSWT
jgi:hypothetical protein